MSNANRGKSSSSTRQSNRANRDDFADANNIGAQLSNVKPRSLSMGPSVIFANAIGEDDAQTIVAMWAPKFRITYVSELPEHVGWQ